MKREYILTVNFDGSPKSIKFEIDTMSQECKEYYESNPSGDYTHWKAHQILAEILLNIEWGYERVK